METYKMEWIKDTRYTNLYYVSKVFNGYQYNAVMTLEETDKSVKYWFSISSGKKRKEFEIFQDKKINLLVESVLYFGLKRLCTIFQFSMVIVREVRDNTFVLDGRIIGEEISMKDYLKKVFNLGLREVVKY